MRGAPRFSNLVEQGINSLWLKLPGLGTELAEVQLRAFPFNLHAQVVNAQLFAGDGAEPGGLRLGRFGGLLDDDDRREDIRFLEDLLGVAEVHHRLDPGLLAEEAAERFAVAGLHPLVGDDEGEQSARFQQPQAQFVEVDVEVGHAVVGVVVGFQPRLEGGEQLLPDVGRVADHDVEAALGEDFGEGGLPVEGLGVDGRVADDAVALADGVVEAGQAACRARRS